MSNQTGDRIVTDGKESNFLDNIHNFIPASLVAAVLAYLILERCLQGASIWQLGIDLLTYYWLVMSAIFLTWLLRILLSRFRPSLLSSYLEKNASWSIYYFSRMLLLDTTACWMLGIHGLLAALLTVIGGNLAAFYSLRLYRRQKIGA